MLRTLARQQEESGADQESLTWQRDWSASLAVCLKEMFNFKVNLIFIYINEA